MGAAARWVKRPGEMSDGFASNLRDALPNASFIGWSPSLPLLGRASPNAAQCLFASLRSPSGQLLASDLRLRLRVQSPCSFGSPDLQEEAVKTVLAQAELHCAELG
jgi:hypothetical protein